MPNVPRGLPEPFETPHLIIPIDKANPSNVTGNGYVAQLSPTVSTVFVFDVKPTQQGKTCTLTFDVPPAFDYPALAPLHIQAPGGIEVSRLRNTVSPNASVVGTIGSVALGSQYDVASFPCESGQTVRYQVDSIGGLTMDWFQMTNPPAGLFMLVR